MKKELKGFTLIELLAVIIVLTIIALIATPIVLNLIAKAQDEADIRSVEGILDSARLYKNEAMLDSDKQNKIDNLFDIYEDVKLLNKPDNGKLYVNNNGLTAIAIVIRDKCYRKEFTKSLEITKDLKCDLGYIGIDKNKPTISQKVTKGTINENGWYKEDLVIDIVISDEESGVSGYNRCMGNGECEPNEEIYDATDKIILNNESNNYTVCVIGVDNQGNKSEKNCAEYKIDKTAPTVGNASITGSLGSNNWYISDVSIIALPGTDSLSGHSTTTTDTTKLTSNTTGQKVTITTTDLAGNTSTKDYTIKIDKNYPTITAKTSNFSIVQGDNVNTSTYFNSPTYSISGGSISCNPVNTSSLPVGSQNLTCTAIGNNGLKASASKVITVNVAYTGIPNGNYTPGQNISYAGLLWKVIRDNGNNTTLILASNYTTSMYGSSTNWAGSNANSLVNVSFVSTYPIIQNDINKGGIIYDYTSNSYVRLAHQSEISTAISNDSNTPFWTMTANGNDIWFAQENGTLTIKDYSVSSKSLTTGLFVFSCSYSSVNVCTLSNRDTLSIPNVTQVSYNNVTSSEQKYYAELCYGFMTAPSKPVTIRFCSPTGVSSITTQTPYGYADSSSCKPYTVCSYETVTKNVGIRPVITVFEK